KGVFYVADNSMIKGKTVLLIDDVFTTGATINECSRTLKKHSVRLVYSLTACITQLKVYSE
ncbi:MAG: phosphoribosyltransferase family protein, partial [Clostridia bacterium]